MNYKTRKKIVAFFLSGMVILGNMPITALAETNASEKEEIVYANLHADGSLKDVNVVNVFETGDFVDYGIYSEIKNLTTTDTLTQDGDAITGHTDEDKIYYQGTMENAELPWNITIKYYLDGKETSAAELVGATGEFQLNLDITENKKSVDGFWDGFALQITMKLDSEKCSNIVSENATIANVGADKQLTYIVLPGKGANIQVTANVTDFYMESIALNAMELNLDISLDTDAIIDQFAVVKDAIVQIDEGSGQLNDGIEKLNDNSEKIQEGSEKLEEGSKDVDEASNKVNKGAKSLKKGTKTLDESMDELLSGVKTMKKGLAELSEKSEQLTDGSEEVMEALKTIQTALKGVDMKTDSLEALLDGSTQVSSGIDAVVNGLETIDEKIELFYDTLKQNGISDVDELIEYHEKMLTYVSYTDTQKALYDVYEETGKKSSVLSKLIKLKNAGDKEATELYNKYIETSDSSVIVDYVTEAGLMINLEKLAKADIKYFEGTDALISGIYETLDEEKTDGLMAGVKELQTQYAVFHSGIETMVTSLKELVSNMEKLSDGINKLVENYDVLDQGIGAYTSGVNTLKEGYEKLYSGVVSLSEGTQELYEGTTSLYNGTSKLAKGTETLAKGAEALSSGLDTYTEGVESLYEGSTELKKGTGKFADMANNLSEIVTNVIDGIVDKMTGKTVKTGSFASEKNMNVKSVLFVIKTPAISAENEIELSNDTEEAKPNSFWEKILNLFGIN